MSRMDRPALGGREVDDAGINRGLLRCPRCLSRIASKNGVLTERRGADAVDFPESLSPQLVELLRGIFTVSIGGGGGAVRWTLPQIEACEWLRGGEDYVPAPVSVEETIAEIVWPEPTEDQALDSFPLQDDDDDLVGSMDQFEAHDTGPMLQLGGGGHSLDLSGGHLRGDGAP